MPADSITDEIYRGASATNVSRTNCGSARTSLISSDDAILGTADSNLATHKGGRSLADTSAIDRLLTFGAKVAA
jgi:hypothetical protein